jgi:hypothetical protein
MAKENFSGGLNSLLGEPQRRKEGGAGRTKSTKERNY